MSDETPITAPVWKVPLLCAIALLMVLGMLRLGVWQLDRADQKREIVAQLELLSEQAAVPIVELFNGDESAGLRFRKVTLKGQYLQNTNFYVDNKVVNGQVGYQIFTPFQLEGGAPLVMVARGWVSIGESRQNLPNVVTKSGQIILEGRLNTAPAKPPLWSEQYSVSDGDVWQYLPMLKVAGFLQAKVFPLVVELAPSDSDVADDTALVTKWPEVDDQQVAKHLGYAFQWFAMAVAFFIACLILLLSILEEALEESKF
ncbi:MAG: SURF1 family protein [Arenicella sp.]|nr:SURF1 family protein [Arenicella sp.]